MKEISGQPRQWREIAPQIWEDVSDAQQKLIFDRDSSGRWFISLNYPFEILQPIAWYQSKTLIQTAIVCAYFIFLLTLLLWPVAAITRRHYGCKVVVMPAERSARRWTRLVCFVLFLYWSLLVGGFVVRGDDLNFFSSGNDWWFRSLQIFGWLGALGTFIAIWNFFVSWGATGRWWWAKLHDTLILAACLATLWIVWYGHLLAFSLRY